MLREILVAIFALIGVLGLIVLTFYATRKLNGFLFRTSGKTIRVLERELIAKDTSIAIVRAGERYLLLGITPQHVETLCEFSHEEGEAFEESVMPAERNENGTFLDNLKIATAEHPYVKPFIRNKNKENDDDGK